VPDPLSPIQSGVILHRIDPEHTMARYYGLMIERDLFGTVRLVRHCGRIGAIQRRERLTVRCARPLPLERFLAR
jgi:hypothetical protein